MGKVAREVAESEVTRWLDYKKVFASQREKASDAIELMIDAVEEGVLILNEDYTLTQKILVPSGDKPVEELTYQPRLNGNMKRPYMKGEDATDGEAQLTATIAALTKQPKGVIRNLDSVDQRVANSIATFFF